MGGAAPIEAADMSMAATCFENPSTESKIIDTAVRWAQHDGDRYVAGDDMFFGCVTEIEK